MKVVLLLFVFPILFDLARCRGRGREGVGGGGGVGDRELLLYKSKLYEPMVT